MNFKASILILATLKIFSAKSIEKDQAAIIQSKIPDEKQFYTEKKFSSFNEICLKNKSQLNIFFHYIYLDIKFTKRFKATIIQVVPYKNFLSQSVVGSSM